MVLLFLLCKSSLRRLLIFEILVEFDCELMALESVALVFQSYYLLSA